MKGRGEVQGAAETLQIAVRHESVVQRPALTTVTDLFITARIFDLDGDVDQQSPRALVGSASF